MTFPYPDYRSEMDVEIAFIEENVKIAFKVI